MLKRNASIIDASFLALSGLSCIPNSISIRVMVEIATSGQGGFDARLNTLMTFDYGPP